MSVRQQRGKWLVDIVFEHADGRHERVRKVSPVNTKRGAEEYERQVRARLLEPRLHNQKEIPTFKQFVQDRWWPTYPTAAQNRHTTILEKECHLRVHLMPFFANLRLDAINKETLLRFLATLTRDKKVSAKRAKNVMGTLRTILSSAVEWDVIASHPKFPRIKVSEASFDFYTREESDALLAKARSNEERALLMFALHTGARAGELIAIEWSDIDWHNRLVVFRRSRSRGVTGPTKSGKERKVPLTSALEAALRDMRHLKGPLVFCNADGSPLSVYQLHERLWGAQRRAGLRKIRWHDLRHSFASQLIMAGTPIRQVQEWLGHSTIMMTMRYSHLAPGGGREFLAALDGSHGNLTATQKTEIAKSVTLRDSGRPQRELNPCSQRERLVS